MKKGLLIVLSGPSGVGKKTVWEPLIKSKELRLAFSISMTTRNKRFDEVDGRDYFFVTKQQFKKAIDTNQMLEYATYVDNYYGTPERFVNELRAKGKNVLLEIEPNGALQIMDYARKNKDDGVVTIFIAPPSINHLRERLEKRGTESTQRIQERIKQAEWEMSLINHYKYCVINDDHLQARNELVKILNSEIHKNDAK